MKNLFSKQNMTIAALIAGVAAVALSAGALNGGVAPTASAWDGLVLWFQGMMTSTWVIVMALIVLVGAVWQLAHGGGYKMLSVVLGVLAVALIGPGLVTTVATATGQQAMIVAPIAHVSSAAQL